jgi:hypothetical protein
MAAVQRLKVSDNRRFIMNEDGSPFIWLGDTAWELFHKLNREEVEHYLDNRAERGFSVIQAVALAELDGLTTGNAYGQFPLLMNDKGEYDPTLPDLAVDGSYGYWDHVDFVVDSAAKRGMYIGLLPTWGDKFNQAWGKGPAIFNGLNAEQYGAWIANRYKDRDNIIWILGGDRLLIERVHFEVIHGMAEGIRREVGNRQLITLHPAGAKSSSYHVHEEKWLDFNMIQSGHHMLNNPNYEMVEKDYARLPVKPTLDGEPCYEEQPINFKTANGYFDAKDVRQAAYWSLFSGSFGHTYGHHCVWSMIAEPDEYFHMHWKEAIERPGASQMRHVRKLLEARPYLDRVCAPELVAVQYEGANHISACRGDDYAFVYSSNGLPLQIDASCMKGEQLTAHWYDPRTGEFSYIGEFGNQGVLTFIPPSRGRNDDWILVLDDASKGYVAGVRTR